MKALGDIKRKNESIHNDTRSKQPVNGTAGRETETDRGKNPQRISIEFGRGEMDESLTTRQIRWVMAPLINGTRQWKTRHAPPPPASTTRDFNTRCHRHRNTNEIYQIIHQQQEGKKSRSTWKRREGGGGKSGQWREKHANEMKSKKPMELKFGTGGWGGVGQRWELTRRILASRQH